MQELPAFREGCLSACKLSPALSNVTSVGKIGQVFLNLKVLIYVVNIYTIYSDYGSIFFLKLNKQKENLNLRILLLKISNYYSSFRTGRHIM